jgi:hypothetical protein
MITKEVALRLKPGDKVRHKHLCGRDGKPMKAVVTARAHVNEDPEDPEYTKGYFSVAVICDTMHHSIEITNYTCNNWEVV